MINDKLGFFFSVMLPVAVLIILIVVIFVAVVWLIMNLSAEDKEATTITPSSKTGNEIEIQYIDTTVIRCHPTLGKGVWYDRVGYEGYYKDELTSEEYQEWCVNNPKKGKD